MLASMNDLNTGMSVLEAPSPVTKSTLSFVDQLRCAVDGLGRIGLVVDQVVIHRHAADLVAELFERQIDAALGLGAGAAQSAR